MFPPAPFAPGEIYGKGVLLVDAASRILEIVSAIRPIPACGAHVTQLLHEEDGEPYEVWRVDVGDQRWILKKAKEYEFIPPFSQLLVPMSQSCWGPPRWTVVTIFWKSS